jgi:hypothetical protein
MAFMRLAALLLPCTVACAGVCLSPGGRAAAAPLRVLVRVPGPDEEDLLLRLRGQTVDLDVALIADRDRRPMDPTFSGQLAAAAALAAAHGARVVVWISQGDGRLLCVGEPARARVLVRPLPQHLADPASRSVAAEGAALVVRSALQALLRGDPVGVPTASLVPAAVRPPRPPSPAARAPLLRRPGFGAGFGFFLGGGWQVALDGQSPAGQHALVLQGGLRLGAGALSLGLWGAAALPAHLVDDLTDVSLSRHGAGLAAAHAFALSPRLRLSVGGALGVLLFHRATLALSPEVNAAPDRLTPAFTLAPEARLQVRALPGLLGELVLAADVPIGAPELGYADPGGGFEVRNRLWPVQPRLGLAIYYDAR